MQMLGFPFGEDMPWSEEVEPIQYTLPVFQLEFKVTAEIFLFQFWVVTAFCIVYCLLCLGDVHEKLMDEIAANMGDSTFENVEDSEVDEKKSWFSGLFGSASKSPSSPKTKPENENVEGEIVIAASAAANEPLMPWGGHWKVR